MTGTDGAEGDLPSIEIGLSERFERAADEWGDRRMMDDEDAMETKVEQALLEVEHLVSGRTEVEFALEGRVVRYEPSEELSSFLTDQADRVGIDPSAVLELHVELFARAFLDQG